MTHALLHELPFVAGSQVDASLHQRRGQGLPPKALLPSILGSTGPQTPCSSALARWASIGDQKAACSVLPVLLALAASRARHPAGRRLTRRRAVRDVPITDATRKEKKARDYCKKNAKIEVMAPSKRWREAKVVKRSGDAVTVHYMGYDAQFDEQISVDDERIRPWGGLNAEKLQDLKSSFVLQGDAGCCPGCGVRLQCTDKMALGYIPPEKLVKEEDSADAIGKPLRAEDEVALLLKEEGAEEKNSMVFATRASQVTFKVIANVFLDIRKEPDINSERVEGESLVYGDTFQASEIYRSADARSYFRLADGRGWVFDWGVVKGATTQLVAPVEDGLAKIKKAQKAASQNVCLRCWGLWHYNDCDDILRPAYGGNAKSSLDELTADAFEQLLTKTLEPVEEACIFAVVDVFDFGPSATLLEFLAKLLKGKPGVRVRIIANKIDLLPKETSIPRIRGWVAQEAQRAGHQRMKITDVYPVSCHNGEGITAVSRLFEQQNVRSEHYAVGAANAGKSSLLNRLSLRKRKAAGQVSDQDATGFVVSVLPGTTLRPLVMKHQAANTKIIDMPGLLVPGSLAERLTLEDLKEITPQKNGALRLTFHMNEGRTILLGALARIDFVSGRPFQFTVFASEKLKLHRTRIDKAETVAKRWAGTQLTPPVDARRYDQLLPWESHRFELTGAGWDEACIDVVFPGLGWVAITGCGECVVEAHAPEGVNVTTREPLMPYEARWTGVKYRGYPGWYRVNGRSTRGFEVGNARKGVKGRF